MQTQILYFGNYLTEKGKTPTGINFLGDLLAKHYSLMRFSDKENRLLRLLDMVTGFLKNASRSKYILIDVYSGWGFYYALIVSLLAMLYRKPYLPILHGGKLPERFEKSPLLTRLILRNAFKIITPSPFLAEPVEAMGYSVVYIPNPIDLNDFDFRQRSKVTPRLLWVRSLKSLYNPTMAVRVLAELRKTYSNASLCLVGPIIDGSEAACRSLAKNLGLNGELRLTGMLSKNELKNVAAEYDIFINTTHADNVPMSLVEAMASGLPIVSTDVGGLPYLIQNEVEGLLTPPDNYEAMAAGVVRLLNDSNLVESLTKNALEKARFFDKEKVQEQWRAILK